MKEGGKGGKTEGKEGRKDMSVKRNEECRSMPVSPHFLNAHMPHIYHIHHIHHMHRMPQMLLMHSLLTHCTTLLLRPFFLLSSSLPPFLPPSLGPRASL